MAREDGKLLVYFDDEAHLVRRLGAAVVACWANLPEAVQIMLVDRANIVMDEEGSDHVGEQMKQFIAHHTKGD